MTAPRKPPEPPSCHRYVGHRPGSLVDRILGTSPHGEQGARQVRHLQRRDRRRRGRHPVGDRRDRRRLDQHRQRAARRARQGRGLLRRREVPDRHLHLDRRAAPTATTTSLDGDFTLKGVTKPVSLDLEFNGINPGMGHGEVAGFEASVVLNRKDFGIDIDLPLETGGTVVGDKVTITLEIEALKQAYRSLRGQARASAGRGDPADALAAFRAHMSKQLAFAVAGRDVDVACREPGSHTAIRDFERIRAKVVLVVGEFARHLVELRLQVFVQADPDLRRA